MRNDVYIRALTRAVQILGSQEAAADHLHASVEQVQWWLEGVWPTPLDTFASVVDILLHCQLDDLRWDSVPHEDTEMALT